MLPHDRRPRSPRELQTIALTAARNFLQASQGVTLVARTANGLRVVLTQRDLAGSGRLQLCVFAGLTEVVDVHGARIFPPMACTGRQWQTVCVDTTRAYVLLRAEALLGAVRQQRISVERDELGTRMRCALPSPLDDNACAVCGAPAPQATGRISHLWPSERACARCLTTCPFNPRHAAVPFMCQYIPDECDRPMLYCADCDPASEMHAALKHPRRDATADLMKQSTAPKRAQAPRASQALKPQYSEIPELVRRSDNTFYMLFPDGTKRDMPGITD